MSPAAGMNLPHRKQVVATVNGEKIYLDEYQKRLNAQKGLLSAKALTESLNKQELLDEEILESMITEKIVLQRARELNLSVSDTELERKLLDIRKDYGDNFFNLLTQQNVRYEDWREELRKEMLWDKLVAADVNAQIRVSEDEAEDYFNDRPGLCKSRSARSGGANCCARPGKSLQRQSQTGKWRGFCQSGGRSLHRAGSGAAEATWV
ncbi:MAG: SurA N-terminal domain-containing protein [Desulfobacterales bacterium]|nr:SurA N-terminal domain-containing protein [Desulfobacterales bacterium]